MGIFGAKLRFLAELKSVQGGKSRFREKLINLGGIATILAGKRDILGELWGEIQRFWG